MIKKENGITLVSLIITIMLMLIISSTTIHVSKNRFEINNFSKMKNDIIFLDEKVADYYLKYRVLPILRDNDGTGKQYSYTALNFEKNSGDNLNYYILDLEAMEGLALNYGEEGFKNPNTSDDVYIINEKTHTIYYVTGIELNGELYHYLTNETNMADNIPPTKPEIKVISGTKNAAGIYTTEVQVEIIPGKDNVSGIEKTTYTINDGEEVDIAILTNNIIALDDIGTHEIKAKSYDKNGNVSDSNITITRKNNLSAEYQEVEYIESTGTQYIDTGVKMNENTIIEIKNTVADGTLLGVQDNNNCFSIAYALKTEYFRYYVTSGKTFSNNTFCVYRIENNKIYVDSNLSYTENNYSYADIDLTLYLFARNLNNVASGFSNRKVYYAKIYQDDILIRNFIPCKSKLDGAIGLYDTVNNVFYKNAATSGDNFIAGPEVE